MLRRLTFVLLAALAMAAPARRPLRAQVVETPTPFDSVGRLMAITPAIAAKLMLRPPAWRVTGDYLEARLFALGDGAWVLVVTRRTGQVERYSLTDSDREYLMARTSALPPTVEEEVQKQVGHTAQRAYDVVARSAFIRNQTVLGLTEYGLSGAGALTTDAAGRTAAYLIIAGGSFFGASELSRDLVISEPMNHLSTHAATRGGLAGYGAVYALGGGWRAQAAGVFAGGLMGTGFGLYGARHMNDGEATAAGFGADVMTMVTIGAELPSRPDSRTSALTRSQAGAAVALGLAGYPLGAWYGRRTAYDVTGGDVYTLYVTGAIGMAASSTLLLDRKNVGDRTKANTLIAGFLVGTYAGDRLLVRRFDHSRSAAATLGLGAVAGGLMGGGVFVLTSRNRENDVAAMTLGTLGAIGGVALSERLFPSAPDARRTASRLEFTPTGVALAVAGVPGTHPVLHVTF